MNKSSSPISVTSTTRAGRIELTVAAKAPWRATRQMDVVTLEWRAAGKMERVSLGIAGLPDVPRG